MSYLIQITGLVPKTKLRSFLYQSANNYTLSGYITDKGTSIILDISGNKENIQAFFKCLSNFPLQTAKISKIIAKKSECNKRSGVFILKDEGESNLKPAQPHPTYDKTFGQATATLLIKEGLYVPCNSR